MTPSKPDTPERIIHYILNGLDRQDAETLREIAAHAGNLAAWKKAKVEAELEKGRDVVHEDSAENSSLPDGVPKKAGAVVKTINDNQHYYYQWREGDQMKSKYKGPVSPSE